MKKILDLTAKDILQNLRDKQTFLFLLIMPVAFTLLFGFAFGAFKSNQADPRLRIAYLDLDQEELSTRLCSALAESAVIRLDEPAPDEASLEKQAADDQIAAALVIPEGYSQALLTGEHLQLKLMVSPTSQAGQAAQAEIQTIVSRFTSAAAAANAILGAPEEQAPFTPVMAQMLDAWQEPPIQLVITQASGLEKESGGNPFTSFSHTAPGMMLQFAIAGLLGAAQVIVNERKSRTLKRLLTTTVTVPQVLLGHFLAIVLIILGQLTLLTLFGQVFLKLDYFAQLPATLVMVLTTALMVGALGLLIGAVAKTEEQAILFALVPMFIFAGLGGAWVPLEVTSPAFQAVGHFSPVAWAMEGFKTILVRGEGFPQVGLPALALLGYAALFFGLAVWRFRTE